MRVILTLALVCATAFCFAQTCCDTSPTTSFADLGAQKRFKKAHAEPVPHTYKGDGSEFSFPVDGGEDGRGFIIRAPRPTTKYLFVFHEWWGLNDHVKTQADQFYQDLDNVTVICLDLYDGLVADNRDDASKLMQEADETRIRSIIDGAIEYVGARAKVATVGWCFGGGWSMQASIALEERGVGCIIYYGMPETDKTQLANLQADVLGIFASKDNWINGKVVKEFEEAMVDNKKNLDLVTFDADHAFANPSNPKHNKKAAREAYELSLEFLHNHF